MSQLGKLFLTVLVGALAISALLVLAAPSSERELARERVRSESLERLVAFQRYDLTRIQERGVRAALLGASPQMEAILVGRAPADDLEGAVREVERVTGGPTGSVLLIDVGGRIVASSGLELTATDVITTSAEVRAALSGAAQEGALHVNNELEVVFTAVTPVRNGHSIVIGAVVVAEPLDPSAVAQYRAESGADILIFSGGQVVASTLAEPALAEAQRMLVQVEANPGEYFGGAYHPGTALVAEVGSEVVAIQAVRFRDPFDTTFSDQLGALLAVSLSQEPAGLGSRLASVRSLPGTHIAAVAGGGLFVLILGWLLIDLGRRRPSTPSSPATPAAETSKTRSAERTGEEAAIARVAAQLAPPPPAVPPPRAVAPPPASQSSVALVPELSPAPAPPLPASRVLEKTSPVPLVNEPDSEPEEPRGLSLEEVLVSPSAAQEAVSKIDEQAAGTAAKAQPPASSPGEPRAERAKFGAGARVIRPKNRGLSTMETLLAEIDESPTTRDAVSPVRPPGDPGFGEGENPFRPAEVESTTRPQVTPPSHAVPRLFSPWEVVEEEEPSDPSVPVPASTSGRPAGDQITADEMAMIDDSGLYRSSMIPNALRGIAPEQPGWQDAGLVANGPVVNGTEEIAWGKLGESAEELPAPLDESMDGTPRGGFPNVAGPEGDEADESEAQYTAPLHGGLIEAVTAQKPDPYEQLFREFVSTRRKCGESVDKVTLASFTRKLEKTEAAVKSRYECQTVKFEIYVKNGRAAIRATPTH